MQKSRDRRLDTKRHRVGRLVVAVALTASFGLLARAPALAQATAPGAPTIAPANPSPSTPAPATPAPKTEAPSATPATPTPVPAPTNGSAPADKVPDGKALAPGGEPSNTEIEPHAAPGIPDNATTENVMVPARPLVMMTGQSSYDDAFKSIKTSLMAVKAAMDKAGLKPSGHPITIFSEPDDKGFKYIAAIPIAEKPATPPDLGKDVTIGVSPAGKAIKFQHRGAYDDIDSTYDVITAYLDAKGMQVDNPYIEEYLTDLTDAADPNLQVDIYVFVKK